MSSVLLDKLTQLTQLTLEAEAIKNEIKKEKMETFFKKISDIQAQICAINEEIKPLEKKKLILCDTMNNIKKEMISQCEHEFIDYRNFDGHSTYSHYKCQICGFDNSSSGNFKIIERRYDY